MNNFSVAEVPALFTRVPVAFEQACLSELSEHYSDALQQMSTRQMSGLVIKHFLGKSEIETLIDLFDSIPDSEKTVTPAGSFYPELFPEFDRRVKPDSPNYETLAREFFLSNECYANDFATRFSVDLYEKLRATLATLSSGMPIISPTGKYGEGCYAFGSFRCFPANTSAVPIHCGNYFQTQFRQVYSDLTSKVEVLDQLSYFVTLQAPDSGGELDVFGLNWATGMGKSDILNDKEVILPNGTIIEPDNHSEISKVRNRFEPGDLLLFQGGSIWHRVAQVAGSKPRMTFGGFLAPDKDGKSYCIWS